MMKVVSNVWIVYSVLISTWIRAARRNLPSRAEPFGTSRVQDQVISYISLLSKSVFIALRFCVFTYYVCLISTRSTLHAHIRGYQQ